MSGISTEMKQDPSLHARILKAIRNSPQRPLNGYFKYRTDKLAELKEKGSQNLIVDFNRDYNQLTEEEKAEINRGPLELQQEFKRKQDQWVIDFGITQDQMKKYLVWRKEKDDKERRARSNSSSSSQTCFWGKKHQSFEIDKSKMRVRQQMFKDISDSQQNSTKNTDKSRTKAIKRKGNKSIGKNKKNNRK